MYEYLDDHIDEIKRYLRISYCCMIVSVALLLAGATLAVMFVVSGSRLELNISLVLLLASRLPIRGSEWAVRRCEEERKVMLDEICEEMHRDFLECFPEDEET